MFQEAQARSKRGTGPRGPKPFWSESELETALDMWGKGHSASQIGDAIGYTRSAVLGKLHRLRNKGADVDRASPKPRQTPTRKATAYPKLRNVPFVPALFKAEQIRPSEYDANSRRIDLVDTGPLDCRYIVEGEGADALYCGMAKPHGRGFCDHHHSRCFYTPRS